MRHAPVVVERGCGGWLATSPPESPFRFGVTGPTEADAVAEYAAAEDRWYRLLAEDTAEIEVDDETWRRISERVFSDPDVLRRLAAHRRDADRRQG